MPDIDDTEKSAKAPIDVATELRALYLRQKSRTATAMENEAGLNVLSSDATRNIEVCAKLLEMVYEIQQDLPMESAIAGKDKKIKGIIDKYK